MSTLERMEVARNSALALVKKRSTRIKTELNKEEPDRCLIQIQYKTLETTFEEMQTFWTGILEKILNDNCTQEEYDEERSTFDKVNEEWFGLTLIVNRFLGNYSPTPSSHNSTESSSKKKTFKLPKIELKKFSGELTEWLGWWTQFVKIHEDEDLHTGDKFQYLLQAMVVGSRARDLVESYPMTEENYPKVIKALQQRFGKHKLLKQVYVRELLKIVIQNSKTPEKVRLSKMFDKLESHLRALETLGVTPEQTAEFVFPMVESGLPEDIFLAWQRSTLYGQDGSKMEPPKTELDFLMKFLRQEVEREGQRTLVRAGFESSSHTKDKPKEKGAHSSQRKQELSTAAGLFSGINQMCIFCEKKDSHQSPECYKAQTMSLADKNDIIKEKKRCFICLRSGHGSKDCKSKIKCIICSKRHVVVMCPELPIHKVKKEDQKSAMTSHQCSGDVLLQTLLVRVWNENSNNHKIVRLVFDNGSQGTSVRKDTTQHLGLKPVAKVWSRKVLFGGGLTEKQKHNQFNLNITSLDKEVRRNITALDESEICGNLGRIPQGPWLEELARKNIYLSDFESENPEIELLIGSDYYGQMMTGQVVQLDCGLTAIESVFGWTISGRLPKEEENSTAMLNLSTALMSYQNSISDLWSLEAIGILDSAQVKSKLEREEATKAHFQETVSRDAEGRYSVRLPWIDGALPIPHNRMVAMRRLESTTKKLIGAGKVELYDSIFKGWLHEGFIEVVQPKEDKACEEGIHYLPHHAVFKPTSITTPVRPVFDASCKLGRNPSLNECLEKGPNLLELIPSILLRFREKKYGVVSDIRKAFQMIDVEEIDRDYLRFLWWEDIASKKIQIFRHKRVVFGINCSPYLLGAVIEMHLMAVEEEFKGISQKLLRSLYMDNVATSVDSLEEYETFKRESTAILLNAKMELRQWECSTVEGTGVGLATSGCGLGPGSDCTPQALTTVLGIKWHKIDDTLGVDIPQEELPEKITKRVILSLVQKIFDPMGFLCPTTLVPKMLLQEAWSMKTAWDQDIDGKLNGEFKRWWLELPELRKVQVPRFAFGNSSQQTSIQLHTFCDASQKAYAAAVFVRIEDNNNVTIQLLQAKSRVSPIKLVTIPRLELLGCNIGARLLLSVQKALSLENTPSFLWSDSTTALAWIRRNDEWGTFVGNRVKEICVLTKPEQWNYVPGSLNPADLPSRGCSPSQLLQSRWWEGPEWLLRSEESWPKHKEEFDEEVIMTEIKKGAIVSMQAAEAEIPWFLTRYSSYNKNLRHFSWILRFVKQCRSTGQGVKSQVSKLEWDLTRIELDEAEKKWFLLVQKEVFDKSKGSVICGLKTEVDKDGLIRVRTKLTYRKDSEFFRCPILLPNSHSLVDQLILDEHKNNGHGGAQYIMGRLREKCWIIQGRRAVRRVLAACIICRRFTSNKPNVPLAPLPENRVKDAKVFQITGVDLAGPLYLRDQSKTWMVLFTCAVYRCIHLELVDSLSTDAFLLALYRFISRRGRPSTIYSDNGTNFTGADNLMRQLDWKKIMIQTRTQKIQWIFNPPSAAWWGGWWERLIRSSKDLIKRMLGQNRLNYAQLETCLCQVEAIINERPLTYITEDADDLIPLTPAMFLHDIQETDYPEAVALDSEGLNGKFKSMNTLREELRNRFRKEYLAHLVQRGKDKKINTFQVGDVVLIGDDDKKRLLWQMGRILELYPGRDGEIRVAKVKTATGSLLRPLQRLYPLEVSISADCCPVSEKVKKVAVLRNKKKQVKAQETIVHSSLEPHITTRSGRQVKKPARFGL